LSRFVLDCSITMTWCFENEVDRYSDEVLDALDAGTALVPALWPIEVVNVLAIGERRKRLTRADSARFLQFLSEMPLVVDGALPLRQQSVVLALAREYRLSGYDALYLHLAMRERVPLATRDTTLRAAAKAAGVAAFRAS
jgi:predicted nucleic acid-binding protein